MVLGDNEQLSDKDRNKVTLSFQCGSMVRTKSGDEAYRRGSKMLSFGMTSKCFFPKECGREK